MQVLARISGIGPIRTFEPFQSLWGGYGTIGRIRTINHSSLILKEICFPPDLNREEQSSRSHQRKLRSYQIEREFYGHYAPRIDQVRLPRSYGSGVLSGGFWILLEDLDEAGFPVRSASPSEIQFQAALRWLAGFHAYWLNENPAGLWKEGTYWHLETRPDELKALKDPALKKAASAIDQKLKQTVYRTILHGDAKPENFCFSKDGQTASAVDYQYTGGGCGMKDLVYLVDCSLNESQAKRRENEILDRYFRHFSEFLSICHPEIRGIDVENDWRPLYRTAWADFQRFLRGWSPGYAVRGGYSDEIIREVTA
jgi:hypothetical protein